jgi:hypothetical protein
MALLLVLTASNIFGQSLSESKEEMVLIPVADLRLSYQKLIERKALLLYAAELEKEIDELNKRLEVIKRLSDEKAQLHKEIVKVKDDQFHLLERLLKVKKVQPVVGGGFFLQTNSPTNISVNIQGGLMFKQKRIITSQIGVNGMGLFVGGSFLTTF